MTIPGSIHKFNPEIERAKRELKEENQKPI